MSAEIWNDAIQRMLVRIEDTHRRVRDGFPHWADPGTGEWTVTPHGDWTGGCWVGMLWLAHRGTGDEKYRRWAEQWCERLRPQTRVESVFKSVTFYYGGALGALITGSPVGRELALQAARSLSETYDPKLGLIPLGRQAEEGSHTTRAVSSIDSLHAAPFLFWAGRETDDARTGQVAAAHADRVIELHLQGDDSYIQSTFLDPETGGVTGHFTHKGYSDTSIWGRAQAWGILYSTLSYIWGPRRDEWLSAAMRGADWWMAHVPPDRVAFWDFDDPAIPNTERDTAATSIVTAALVKLSALAPDEARRRRYRGFAEETARALATRYLTPTSPADRRVPGILTEGCFNKRRDTRALDAAARSELIFGSYFLFEALHGLAGRTDPTAF